MKAENPFHSLYITEKISTVDYVNVISPLLVPHADKLFMQGNVVVQGTQGSGKTTLLALLKHEIREEYARAGSKFPVAAELSNFISPGINFLKSGILDFGKRPISTNIEDEEDLFPLLFADFFNYYIAIDLFETLSKISDSKCQPPKIYMQESKLNDFANSIKQEDCWFGYLKDISTFEELKDRLKERRTSYRKYHQFNIHKMLPEILDTKTNIGEPISRIATFLKENGIIPADTNIFVRVDQVETTIDSDNLRSSLGTKYRRMLNSALVKRDPNISYKIGSRTYAWKGELRTYNSEETIEEIRSYDLLDVDEMLKRKEHQKLFFPRFVKDIFNRRLEYCNIPVAGGKKHPFATVFGSIDDFSILARKYRKSDEIPSVLKKVVDDFSDEVRQLVLDAFDSDPLDGVLAIAWFLQGKRPNHKNFIKSSDQPDGYPWEERKWWRKERIHLGLMQLASYNRQRLILGGVDDIITLSTPSVLSFLSICQHIWDTRLRDFHSKMSQSERPENTAPIEEISINLQTLGIYSASKQWVEKIDELPGGNKRRRFIENLGKYFRRKLLQDIKMTYPGHTGFSLKIEELEQNPKVREFLQKATDYGVLFETEHISKTQNDPPRKKWYFNPIYCPYLKIYAERIKEPFYTTPDFIEKFIEGHGESQIEEIKVKDSFLPLFDEEN